MKRTRIFWEECGEKSPKFSENESQINRTFFPLISRRKYQHLNHRPTFERERLNKKKRH